jgi:hypothetical protein
MDFNNPKLKLELLKNDLQKFEKNFYFKQKEKNNFLNKQ